MGRLSEKRARKKRKGIKDREKEKEGPVYVFDCEPGPSSSGARTS